MGFETSVVIRRPLEEVAAYLTGSPSCGRCPTPYGSPSGGASRRPAVAPGSRSRTTRSRVASSSWSNLSRSGWAGDSSTATLLGFARSSKARRSPRPRPPAERPLATRGHAQAEEGRGPCADRPILAYVTSVHQWPEWRRDVVGGRALTKGDLRRSAGAGSRRSGRSSTLDLAGPSGATSRPSRQPSTRWRHRWERPRLAPGRQSDWRRSDAGPLRDGTWRAPSASVDAHERTSLAPGGLDWFPRFKGARPTLFDKRGAIPRSAENRHRTAA